MTSALNVSALIIDAPVGRHFAQLHRDSDGLTRSVTRFVEAGLRRGAGVVLIATPVHTESVSEHLRLVNIEPEPYRRSGQLSMYDAAETLERFMRSGMPQWNEFRRVVGTALETAASFSRGATRAY